MKKSSLNEDTLLRMLVAAISETITRLTLLRTTGQYQQALAVIDENLEELLGLKANLVRQLDDQKIIEMLRTNDFLDVGRLYQVAEMFRQEGKIYHAQRQTAQAKISQVRAINLFLEVSFAVEDDFLEADAYIDDLFDILGQQTPEDTLYTLFDYYEQVGAFARAATAINLMLTTTGNNPDILVERQAFYQRLLLESDAELAAGGLSRAEITQKLQGG